MDIDTQIARALIFWIALWVIAALIGLSILYLVIKNAIRDGIKESGLIGAITRHGLHTRPPMKTPDMRAD